MSVTRAWSRFQPLVSVMVGTDKKEFKTLGFEGIVYPPSAVSILQPEQYRLQEGTNRDPND